MENSVDFYEISYIGRCSVSNFLNVLIQFRRWLIRKAIGAYSHGVLITQGGLIIKQHKLTDHPLAPRKFNFLHPFDSGIEECCWNNHHSKSRSHGQWAWASFHIKVNCLLNGWRFPSVFERKCRLFNFRGKTGMFHYYGQTETVMLQDSTRVLGIYSIWTKCSYLLCLLVR